VVEPLPANAEEVHRRFSEAHLARESYDTFLSRHTGQISFDGAVIALPNTLHSDATRRCLEAGLHVLCEKPLALTASECNTLADVALRTGRLLVVGMVRRWFPSIAAMRKALSDGLIGEVTSVELHDGGKFNWPSDTETVFRHDQGGVLLNMGVHFLDCLEWILGELQPVSYGDDSAGGIEVNCAFEMHTKTGAPVSLNVSWTHSLKNAFRVIGTRGTLTAGNDALDSCKWESCDGTLQAKFRIDEPFKSGHWRHTLEACFVEQLWRFASAAKTPGGGHDLVTGADAARSQGLIDWAYSHRVRKHVPCVVPGANRPRLDRGRGVVTGGTGFVGTHLVARLAELGMTEIMVPVRSFRTGANVARYPVRMKRIDLLSQASCRDSVRGARYVFHLAYGTGRNGGKITIEGTRNMIRAAMAEHVECIVVFSTTLVYGHPNTSQAVDESFSFNPTLGGYGSSKAQMHRECLKLAHEATSTRVVVIVPGCVIGPGGGLFCAMPCEMASQGTFCWIDGGKGIANYTYVSNLVDAAIMASMQPSAHGKDFIIVDGQCSWKELLTPLVEPWSANILDMTAEDFVRLKKRSSKDGTFKDLLRSVLSAPDVMAALSNHPVLGRGKDWLANTFPRQHQAVQALRPGIDAINLPSAITKTDPPNWLDDIFGALNVRFTSAKAQQYLGWHPLVNLAEAQRASIAWLEDRGLRPRSPRGGIKNGTDVRTSLVQETCPHEHLDGVRVRTLDT